MSSQPTASPSPRHSYSQLRPSRSPEAGPIPDMQHQPPHESAAIVVELPIRQVWLFLPYLNFGMRRLCYGMQRTQCAQHQPNSPSQCTDQCVVVACSDPEHSSLNSHCDFVCDSETNCADCNGFNAFLQCCNENHPCHTGSMPSTLISEKYTPHGGEHNNWAPSSPNALRDSRQLEHLSGSSVGASSSGPSSSFPPVTAPRDHRYTPSIAAYQPSPSAETFAPIPSSFSPISPGHPQDPPAPRHNGSHNQQPPASPATSPLLTCMWDECRAQFTSLPELVGHVNLAHLRNPTDTDVSMTRANAAETQAHVHVQSVDDATRLPCLWNNCTEYLQPQHLAGTSSASAEDILLSSLASHLFQDHLGLQHFNNSAQINNLDIERILAEMLPSRHQGQGREGQERRGPQNTHSSTDTDGGATTAGSAFSRYKAPNDAAALQSFMQEVNGFNAPSTPSPQTTATAVSSPTTSNTEISTGESHVLANLSMTVYGKVVQGTGARASQAARRFVDICSHIQVIARSSVPNVYKTSQRRLRYNSTYDDIRKRPYKCDFPGCGKSFAITGALTIHKRIHNGQKPFKCSYCNRGFAESSNLSKHLRTHTGERPYICPEPGCGKAFARPDQLTRHTATHRKKVSATTTEV
ncbi:hypothetical protein NP233_g3497 [Leucocoprinus birnbaumii]|uniref:C2H2-type domain-containing protein n=1 Tax=Leucocoprinus birnbaumii TaxID=56174 RepID=A0AAD5VXT9_9AGAR|nr:hypothetical protein NP233_g3497 [Leucocoprinus birnbaumii]